MQAIETDLASYCLETARRAKVASYALASLSGEVKNRWLMDSAQLIEDSKSVILAANELDIDNAPRFQLTSAEVDRLRLTPNRVSDIARGIREVANLPDPIGEVIEGSTRPNGLQISKVRVPLGVLFFIYESRPNVTADAAAIALKSGNAIILRGGKEAAHSSKAIVDLLMTTAVECGLPADAIQLVNTPDREAVGHFLKCSDSIDLVIPRGGHSLVRRVCSEATMPVLKHYDGNCHVYVDSDADLAMAIEIIENAKCQRMGVCNALESLVVHRSIASSLLPGLIERLSRYSIEVRGDDHVQRIVSSALQASESDWSQEYLGPTLSIKTVDSLDEAISHINRYGSHHTDAIVTRNMQHARRFTVEVDSAAVIVNASTRFNDGGQLGLGAEIGISTDKFHARGPCGVRELTTYKYLIFGEGHVRT